jgi:hypothetical protein
MSYQAKSSSERTETEGVISKPGERKTKNNNKTSSENNYGGEITKQRKTVVNKNKK